MAPSSIDLIRELDFKSSQERLEIIVRCLKESEIDYRMQEYATGVNLIVDLGDTDKRIGVSCHFDRVRESPGANDNGSAVAVCLNIIKYFKQRETGLRVFFFDEEETGLKGSSAYVKKYGVEDLIGLINLELVGMGNKLAVWPVNQGSSGTLLRTFEQCANNRNIEIRRFDRIVTNTADHLSFRRAGLTDAFTVTCISDKDIEAAYRYYEALEKNAGPDILVKILSQAPIFTSYHRPEDSFDKIDEQSILMTADVIKAAIISTEECI